MGDHSHSSHHSKYNFKEHSEKNVRNSIKKYFAGFYFSLNLLITLVVFFFFLNGSEDSAADLREKKKTQTSNSRIL